MCTLAILWDKSKNSLYYMVLNQQTGGTPITPCSVNNISLDNAEETVKGIFRTAQTFGLSELEYKVLQHGTPASGKAVSEISSSVLRAVKSSALSLKLQIRPQRKNKLIGDSLRKFKKGMKALNLASTAKGTAWQIHLWSVALHATNTSHRKVMLNLYARLTEASPRVKAVRQQWQEWYMKL